MLVLIAVALVIAGALATFLAGCAWPLVAFLPALLAGSAWYAWEFSNEAVVFVGLIVILGYMGVAIGVVVRRARASAQFLS